MSYLHLVISKIPNAFRKIVFWDQQIKSKIKIQEKNELKEQWYFHYL